MTDVDVAVRAREYFARQIAWTKSMLELSGDVEADLARGELDAIEALQSRFDAEAGALRRELDELNAVWANASIADATRGEISALAREAESLAGELQARFDAGAELSRELGDSIASEFGDMTRGKRVLDRYRTDRDPRFVDRQA